MAKAFDATLKHLVALNPSGWLEFIGIPHECAELVDDNEIEDLLSADLSTITAAADILMRTSGPGLEYIEFEASSHARTGDRTLRYNVLADYRFQVPVESVVVLLRKEAMHADTNGAVYRINRSGRRYLAFEYDIVRLWEIPAEQILNGPLGVLPTAPLADIGEAALPDVVRRMSDRISAETPSSEAAEVWTAVYVLMGLKYSAEQTRQLLQGVIGMEESVTYQEIIKKGVERGEAIGVAKGEAIGVAKGETIGVAKGEVIGEVTGIRGSILRVGSKRFGPIETPTEDAIREIDSVAVLQRMLDRILEVESWSELLQAE